MLVEKTQIMDQKAMLRAITRISFEIIEHNKGASNLYIIGIMTRGAELAQRVAKKSPSWKVPRWRLDIWMLPLTAMTSAAVKDARIEQIFRFPLRENRLSLWMM